MDSPWPRALGLSLAYSPLLPSPPLPSHFLSSMICGPSLRAKEIERKLRWISLPPSLPSVIPYPAPTSPCIFFLPAPSLFAVACQRIIAAFPVLTPAPLACSLSPPLPSPPYHGRIISEASVPSLRACNCMHVIHFRCLVLRVIITSSCELNCDFSSLEFVSV